MFPFDSRHVAELHGLLNDGCQVPRSGQAKVACHQTNGPRTKLGYDNLDYGFFFRLSFTTCNSRCCGSSLIIATPSTYVGTSMYILVFDLKSYILVFDLTYYMQHL